MPVNASDVGQRVTVPDRGNGQLCFFGNTKFKDGVWCGVWLDDNKVQSSPVHGCA
jgi:dynactin complex subunit